MGVEDCRADCPSDGSRRKAQPGPQLPNILTDPRARAAQQGELGEQGSRRRCPDLLGMRGPRGQSAGSKARGSWGAQLEGAEGAPEVP